MGGEWWSNMDMSMVEMLQDVDVDMRDDGMSITMEGMKIEMQEGEDGSSSMRIVMESATKLATSAVAIASLAALY
jgi:hypothetical protein